MKLRFPPSPTGLLHVGNARVALAVAIVAVGVSAASVIGWITAPVA